MNLLSLKLKLLTKKPTLKNSSFYNFQISHFPKNFETKDIKDFFFPHYTKNIKSEFFSLGRNKKRREYSMCGLSFDIETTSTEINGEKTGWIYHCQMGVSTPNGRIQDVYFFRDPLLFKKALDDISDFLKDRFIICWIHNFSYEFTWLCNYLKFSEIFAKAPNKPIKARYRQIEFRCSYTFSNMNLYILSKTFTITKKAKGDLDYNVIRYPNTILTKREKWYCYCDVKILLEYWHMHILPEYIIGKKRKWLPLTNTAKVRHDMQSRIKNWLAYKRLFSSIYPSEWMYDILRLCFYGGVVRADARYTGQVLIEKIASRDKKSSYPASQLQHTYPMGRWYKIDPKKENDFTQEDYCKIYKVLFKNIKAIYPLSVMPIDKAKTDKERKLDNGRLYSAKYCEIYCTDIDLFIWEHFYSGSVKKLECYVSKRGKLCSFQIESLLDSFIGKETLKGIDPDLYLKKKNMLNSNFGCCVQKHNDCENVFENGEWKENPVPYREGVSEFLAYQWGVYITAWSRYELLMTAKKIMDNGGTVVYMDTDSIKYFYENGKYEWIFETVNDIYDKNNLLAIQYYTKKGLKLDYSQKNIVRNLGKWENETADKPGKVYNEFITLGSKRYLSDGKPTISGLPIEGFKRFCKKRHINPIDAFYSGNIFPAEDIGKTAMTYIHDAKEYTIHNNGETWTTPRHLVHAQQVPFELKITEEYEKFINYVNSLTAKRGDSIPE